LVGRRSQVAERDRAKVLGLVRGQDQAQVIAHYGDFVQLERLKMNSQFGAKRTLVSAMPNEMGASDAV